MNVRVGDVDLKLFLPYGNWDYLYPPASGEVTAEVSFYYCKTPLEYKEPVFDPDINKLTMYCQIDIDERPLFSEDELRRNVAFLVGIISKRFWFIRAAGFIYKGKGIVLLDSEKNPDYSKLINQRIIPHELTFDDRLPESFFLYYSKKPPVPVSCTVFEIGPKGEPRISKEII